MRHAGKRIGAAVVLAAMLAAGAGPALGEPILYRVETERDHRHVATKSISSGPAGADEVRWEVQTTDTDGALLRTGEYLLDPGGGTVSWTVEDPQAGTHHTGERAWDELHLRGRRQGRDLERRIAIDSRPYFGDPHLGLAGLVRSGAKSLEFWALRPDDLKAFPMRAQVAGTDLVAVDGQMIPCARVEWGLTGLLGRFFRRTFWFRESDGLFVKSDAADGVVEVLAGVPGQYPVFSQQLRTRP